MAEKKRRKVIILLSDKDPFMLKTYQYKFEKEAGWDTLTVDDPDNLLNAALKSVPDLIVTDIILKRGNAYSVLEKIKGHKNKKISSIPIIILTDLGQKEDREKTKELGVTEHLIKSETSFNDVLTKVKEFHSA